MTTVERVRTFFRETLPQILVETPQRGDAMRCTFRIRGAGEWFVDLRLPTHRCVEVTADAPAKPAPGCCLAQLELDADVFEAVRASAGSSVGDLIRDGSIVASGDRVRGVQILTSIAKAPPLIWPSGLRSSPLDSGFFAATEDELARAFSGWRPASEEWDPKRDEHPIEPSLAYVTYTPVGGNWWEDLVGFHIALVDDADARAHLEADEDGALDHVFPVVVWRGAVQIRRVPPALTRALAELTDAQLDSTKPRMLRSNYVDARPVARRALSQGSALWFWGYWPHWG